MIVATSGSDRSVALSTIVDPVTLEDISAPFQGNATLSPDGRWLALERYDLTGGGVQEMVLIEAASGAEERIGTPPGYGTVNVRWRPGHTELWAPLYQMTYDATVVAPGTLIKRPGEPALEITGPPTRTGSSYAGASIGQSFFTPDGAYWFSSGSSQTQNRFTVKVGSADDPTGPTFVLNPEGTSSYSYYPLGDGRLMVEAFRTVPERSDIYAVDPTTGTSRLLGEQGVVLAAGAWRALANLHRVDGRGDLTVITWRPIARRCLPTNLPRPPWSSAARPPTSWRRVRAWCSIFGPLRLAVRRHLGRDAAVTAAVALLVATLVVDGGASDVAPLAADASIDGASIDGTRRADGAAPDGGVAEAGPAAPARPRARGLPGACSRRERGRRSPARRCTPTSPRLAPRTGAVSSPPSFPAGRGACRSRPPGFERLTTIVDVCEGPAAPLTFRLMPADKGQSFETVVRSKPAQPEVRLTGEELTTRRGRWAIRSGPSSRCRASRRSPGPRPSTPCAAPTPATPASSWTACACRRCSTSRWARR